MSTKKPTKKQTQARSADPDAIRATVYFPAELHESMRLATEEERKKQRTERARKTGPREYARVTLSAVIIQACEAFVGKYYPKFLAKPKRKAA